MDFNRAAKSFLCYSACLHLVLLIILGFTKEDTAQKAHGNANLDYVNAYFHDPANSFIPKVAIENTTSVPPKTTIKQTIVKQHVLGLIKTEKLRNKQSKVQAVALQANKKIRDAPSSLQKEGAKASGKTLDLLTMLLHDAIAKQQTYPLAAQLMERHGRVSVAFTLLVNGAIENLQIIASSGTDSLDEAAVSAVKQAVPFQKVNTFIHAPTRFQIDIVFD